MRVSIRRDGNLGRQARVIGGVILACFVYWWVGTALLTSMPAHWVGWSLAVDLKVEVDGMARVYFATNGSEMNETDTVNRRVRGGKWRRVYFDLPMAGIEGLRLDPIDQQGEFEMRRLRICGPLGVDVYPDRIWLPEEGEGAQKLVENDATGATRWRAQSTDPHFYLKVKDRPLEPPEALLRNTRAAYWVITALLLWLFTALVIADNALANTFAGVLGMAGLCGFGIAFHVLPFRQLDGKWLYFWFLAPVLLSMSYLHLRQPINWKSAMGDRVILISLGLFGYLGVYVVLGLSGDSLPRRSEILLAIGVLVGILLWTMAWGCLSNPEKRVGAGLMIVWGCGVAVGALTDIIQFYAPDWDLRNRMGEDVDSPLLRLISGSATNFVGALGIVTIGRAWKLKGWSKLWYLLAVPPLLWALLAESRGVLLGFVATSVTLIGLETWARRRHLPAMIGLATFALFIGTNWPLEIADWMTEEEQPTGVSEVPLETAGTEAVTEGESLPVKGHRLLTREEPLRLGIYDAYLWASIQKPVFGHGFGAEHRLPIRQHLQGQLPEYYRGASFSPHSIYLSYLYFTGALGLVLQLTLLGMLVFRLARRLLRDGDQWAGGLLGAIVFAATYLMFESTLMADGKISVLLYYPNEYWLIYWFPIVLAAGYLFSHRDCFVHDHRTPASG